MSLPAVCPVCAAKFPLETALQDLRAREALRAALHLAPQLADPIVAYLGLFSPESTRAVKMDKLVRLLSELSAAISAAQVERHGRAWAAPIELWREGLARVLAQRDAGKLTLPLNGHGLLFEIVAGLASRSEGRREQHREDARRSGEGERIGQPTAVRGTMPEHLKNRGWRKMLAIPGDDAAPADDGTQGGES